MKILISQLWLTLKSCVQAQVKIKAVRKTKPDLAFNEIACRLQLDIPKELFERPQIEANLKIENIPNTAYNPDIIINTKELIEQQTGAKIEFKVLNAEGGNYEQKK